MIIFVPSSGYPLTHTHSAANSEYLNDCGWPQTYFKELLSSSSSCSLVPLISLILQSASREINNSEGHSRRYTEPSSLPRKGSFLDKKSHRTGDLGNLLLQCRSYSLSATVLVTCASLLLHPCNTGPEKTSVYVCFRAERSQCEKTQVME